eukprot:scaffold102528_cov54-Phaeocystis_antarctica.AAC.2
MPLPRTDQLTRRPHQHWRLRLLRMPLPRADQPARRPQTHRRLHLRGCTSLALISLPDGLTCSPALATTPSTNAHPSH